MPTTFYNSGRYEYDSGRQTADVYVGYYGEATANGSGNANLLYLGDPVFSAQVSYAKGYGHSLRCLVPLAFAFCKDVPRNSYESFEVSETHDDGF